MSEPSTDPRAGRLSLWRRLSLTIRYLGWRALLWRIVTFPLRFTPLRSRLGFGDRQAVERRRAQSWFREKGRPVSVVIPTYGPADEVAAAVRSIRATTRRQDVRVIVTDDASPAEHQQALKALDGIDELILGEDNVGFARNANRGLGKADPDHDVVLLNSDVELHDGWLACLQHAVRTKDDVGIAGPKLVYPDGRIQSAGSLRNPGAPEWFDHRYRFKSPEHGPANVVAPAVAMTGACLYLRRECLDDIGPLDERYPMAYEDVDWCLKAWDAGWQIVYVPSASGVHKESVTRGTEVGEREKISQERFWQRWGPALDERHVRTDDGGLRVVYVTEDTGVGGGHRDIFEHLDRLGERGHETELWSLGGQPDWYPLQSPVRTFSDYDELARALAPIEAIKVATWWNTGEAVFRASVLHGIPVFFVQDIETSYYPDDETLRDRVVAGYREEFAYMTISGWNRDRLAELGHPAELIPPGIDLGTFKPVAEVERRDDMLLALGRTNPLKNLPLTIDAWRALREPIPELVLFGIEPELGPRYGTTYVERPSDEGVNELFNRCTVLVQTSTHEGFCLPPLEAMATGAAVVCTDAHGNRDFCVDGVNCLMPEQSRPAVTAAVQCLLDDADLRRRLGEEGRRTAAEYAWEKRIDALEAFFLRLAEERAVANERARS